MAIEGVYATIYYVDDWDASVSFYRDTLGLKARHVERGWAEFAVGKNGTVALHQRDHKHSGVELSLLVSDIEKTLVELEAGGARVVEPIRRQDFGAVATVADPSGNRIGLYELPDVER
jgi:predicted enzyme related to lactoylglutathione lyase